MTGTPFDVAAPPPPGRVAPPPVATGPVLLVVSAAVFLASLDLFIVNIAFPAIGEDFSADADTQIEVIGKQWAWDFNYTTDETWDTSVKVPNDSGGTPQEEIPTLYLPVNQEVELTLHARDVIHSFWVIEFLYKKDMLPGVTNRMYFETGDQEGILTGKCAELCGEYHSAMLFNVELVSPEEYDAYLEGLEQQGFVGPLDESINPATGDDSIDPDRDEDVDTTNENEGN